MMRGDQIISVDGTDVSQARQDEAVALLKSSRGSVKIQVRRYKGAEK